MNICCAISQKSADSVLFSYMTEEDPESSWGVHAVPQG